ncbi:MAG TPA: Maf family nucleotide pyrophosphatase [Paenalcaligenes sp.]|nr:Maf family nucleotide pyrophosphatase [Paenalcaligenes sp.]
MKLILASGSPYRKMMLQRLGLPFEVFAADIDESQRIGESPEALSLRLAHAKAQYVAKKHPDALVIGSDQVAALDQHVLGKPGDHATAVAQLRQMSGQTVHFHTALCVSHQEQCQERLVQIKCRFRQLNDAEIEFYLTTEQPYDTAGSAKAESLGISLLESMHSDDPTAIIGLPLIALTDLLRHFGLNPLQPA